MFPPPKVGTPRSIPGNYEYIISATESRKTMSVALVNGAFIMLWCLLELSDRQ
jgi:hypothetical protein